MTARLDSAAYLRRILDHAPVGIVVTDAQGLVMTWSRHAAEIFGCEEAAALGRPLASLFPGPARRLVRSLLAGGADQTPAPRLLERRSPGGTPQLLELTAVPLTAEEGGPGTLVLVQDATERFRHLHQHRQAEDLLATRARQQAAVAELGQRALAESDLQALFTEASRLVSETLGTELVKVLELSPDGSTLLLRAGVGWREGLVGQATLGTGPFSHAGYTLAASRSVVVEDLRTESRFQPPSLLLEHGAVSGMSTIIGGRARPFGVLATHSTRPRAFTPDDVNFLQSVANVLAAAIERQRAERAVERREAEFRTLTQNIPDIVARFDRDLRHVYLNPVIEAVTGRPVDHFLGKTSREAGMPPDLCDAWERLLRRVFRTGQEETLEFAFPSLDGRRHFQSRVVPEVDRDGAVITVLGITRDITELKRVEDRQRFLAEVGTALVGSLESGEVLATLARLAVPRIADGSVMYVVEEDGRIRRAAVVFQDAAKERAAASVFQSAAVTDDEVHPVARVIRSGTTLLVEQTTEAWGNASFRDPALRRLGEALGVRSLIIAPLSARGRTLGAVSFVQAESGRRYGPADLALVEDLARRAALAVDNARLYQEAQQAVRAREEFLSIASHELRTPLTTVKGYVQLLGRQARQPEPDPARIGALTEQLELQVARLERLVADLLDASRIQQGRLELRPEPLDLRHLASEVLARFDHAPERTGAHRLVLDAPEPVSGSWDPARLDQVLSNLLSNALKYSPQGGPIRLSVRSRGDWAEVAVADQGLGIPPEEQPNLFRPFARGATARRAVGGEGLGLYITQQIVQRHGGSIKLTSEPGRGTTVTVRLPLTPPTPAAAPAEP